MKNVLEVSSVPGTELNFLSFHGSSQWEGGDQLIGTPAPQSEHKSANKKNEISQQVH